MLTYLTENSVYYVDADNLRWKRLPGEVAHNNVDNLVYGEWRDMVGFEEDEDGLVIHYPDSECGAEKAGLACANQHYIKTSPIREKINGEV